MRKWNLNLSQLQSYEYYMFRIKLTNNKTIYDNLTSRLSLTASCTIILYRKSIAKAHWATLHAAF